MMIQRNGKLVEEGMTYLPPSEPPPPNFKPVLEEARKLINGLPMMSKLRLAKDISAALMLAEQKDYEAFLQYINTEIKPIGEAETAVLARVQALFNGVMHGQKA